MSNIRVDLDYTIRDGLEIKFRSPASCSAITGLIVYYPGADGTITSKVFALADAHGNNVGDIDHLFAENVVVKVILDVSTGMAFVQNADTNAYLEAQLASKRPNTWMPTASDVGALPIGGGKLTGQLNVGDNVYMHSNGEGGNIGIVPPSSSGVQNWEIDAHDGNLRFYNFADDGTYNESLKLYKDGSFGSGNTSKTRERLGITPGNIGAAPSGFGLGGQAKYVGDLNSATESGFYYFDEPSNRPFSYGTLIVAKRAGNVVTQIAHTTSGDRGLVAFRVKDGSWQPWEYLNPLTADYVEYRTTKRYFGKPVYIRAFGVASIPVNASTTVGHGIGNVAKPLSITGYIDYGSNKVTVPYHDSDTNWVGMTFQPGSCTFASGTQGGGTPAYVILEYTKTTD